jgi:GDPmannose 4,6-dehydratase
MPTAMITGITGQDGSYLAEHLLGLDYRVVGVARRTSTDVRGRIRHLLDRIELAHADLLDQSSLQMLVARYQPDEIYNLAAQSVVPRSWTQPVFTGEVTALGVTRLLEAIRLASPGSRFYQASSSEMFGNSPAIPQDEYAPFHPRSPYAVSKLYGHWATINYREGYGLHACAGILFNHESPRRGLEFVTRKITHGVARIHHGLDRTLPLGNLDARRDWGFAGDYVQAMHLMLQRDEPADYVVATGESHSVREFCDLAFATVGLDWEEHVIIDPALYRPTEIDGLVGDASRARIDLGWQPAVHFRDLVRMMTEADLALVADELTRGVIPAPA